jgi:hypothetical protein
VITGAGGGGMNRNLVQEFSALDDRMTQQLLAIQQQAVAVGLLAQKLEDEQNNCLSQQGSNSVGGKIINLCFFNQNLIIMKIYSIKGLKWVITY